MPTIAMAAATVHGATAVTRHHVGTNGAHRDGAVAQRVTPAAVRRGGLSDHAGVLGQKPVGCESGEDCVTGAAVVRRVGATRAGCRCLGRCPSRAVLGRPTWRQVVGFSPADGV